MSIKKLSTKKLPLGESMKNNKWRLKNTFEPKSNHDKNQPIFYSDGPKLTNLNPTTKRSFHARCSNFSIFPATVPERIYNPIREPSQITFAFRVG